MMKGITPIISIIMLLLITIGLSAAAWTYMSNYMTGMTQGVVEVSNPGCVNGMHAVFFVKNMGTDVLPTNNIIVINETDMTAYGSGSLTWEDQTGSSTIDKIEVGQVARLQVDNCAGAEPATCRYRVTVKGKTTSSSITVSCMGSG